MSCAVSFLNFVKIFPRRTLLANRFLLLSNPSSPQRNTSTVFFHAHFSRPPSAFSPFIPPLRAPLPFPRPEFSLPLLHQHCFFLSPCSHIFYELRRLLINFSASSPPCRCSSNCPFHPHFLHHLSLPPQFPGAARAPRVFLYSLPRQFLPRALPLFSLYRFRTLLSFPARPPLSRTKKGSRPEALAHRFSFFCPVRENSPPFGAIIIR